MITISNLHFSYRRKKVFTGLSLDFRSGRIYGLLGRNGTGKSTLLRNIAGHLFPGSGNIKVGQHVPSKRQPAFLQEIFLVPEEFYLPNVTVASLVDTNSPFYPAFNNAQFNSYIKAFEIPENQSLQQMSYGQKKKVLISFGLACNTNILLMDEPTNGLDIVSKSQFRKVMAQEMREDKCIIISTHQVNDLENLIDRITIIDEGRVLFDRDIEEIAQRLSFKITHDEYEMERAIYAEPSLKGNVVVTPNLVGEETRVDLELLYKSIVKNGDLVRSLFINS